MRAIRQYAFGGPEELRLEEVPEPRAGEGEVRIRVESVGVHLIDTVIRKGGGPQGAPPAELPMTPGREVAGVVDEAGDAEGARLVGRRVVAHLGARNGGYAELALADRESVHLLPEGVSADAAVAMVGTGRTSLAILELAAPTKDDAVLVTAAAGGIGTTLVQALRHAGATVVAAAGGTEKTALAARVGADHVVDYARAGWTDEVRKALGDRPLTLALDGVGGEIGRGALELLGVGGRLVMFGAASGTMTELSAADMFARGIAVSSAVGARLLGRPGGTRDLEVRALEEVAVGRVVPVVGPPFALAEAGSAHEAMEARATVGKTVLRP